MLVVGLASSVDASASALHVTHTRTTCAAHDGASLSKLSVDVITIARLRFVRRHEAAHRHHRPRSLPLSHHPHRRQPAGLLRPDRLQPVRAHARRAIRCIPVIEIGLLLDLPRPHLQDRHDVPRAISRRGRSRYAQKKRAGRTEPQDARVVDDDRVRVSGCCVFVIIHVKAFKYGPSYECGRRRAATCIAWRWRTSRNPLIVGFYVLSMLVVGSHLWHGVSSAFQSLGLDHPRWTPRILARRQGPRGR